jgi:hypothetical protein
VGALLQNFAGFVVYCQKMNRTYREARCVEALGNGALRHKRYRRITSALLVTHSELVNSQLFDQMTELYPHWVANQSWLMFGFPTP